MPNFRSLLPAGTLRTAVNAAGVLLFLAACVTPEKPAPTPPPPPPPEPAPAVQPVEPKAPPPPRVPTAEERQRADQLASDAIVRLQAGDEPAGRGLLEQALALDANNALAQLMMRQVTADPVAELGSTHFPYTIQRDDTLAKLAQRFLGDRHRFYILARYNDIAQPNRIQVGQVIRIPGKAPPRQAEPPTPAPTPEPARPAPPAPAPPALAPIEDAVAKRLAEGREQERKGDLEGALATYSEILRRDPGQAEAKQRSAAVRRKLVDRYYAEGTAAFARQDLDTAIAAWDRVLELDPEHQSAMLKRRQALDLQERLKRFDSKK